MRRIATVVVAVTVATAVAACGDDRTMQDLLAEACAHIQAERWIEAREPLKVAVERDPTLERFYGLVRASAEPADVPGWAANEMGADAYEGRPDGATVAVWRANAKAGCDGIGH